MSDHAFADDLERAISEMHDARDELRALQLTQADDRVYSSDEHLWLEQAVLSVIDLLRPVALAEDTTADTWRSSNLDHLIEIAGQKTERKTTTQGGGIRSQNTQTYITHVNPDTLLTATRVLDELAYSLGFGPETNVESGSWDVQVET